MRPGADAGAGVRPLAPGPPARWLGWVRGSNPEPERVRVPVWMRVVLTVAVTLALGTWGYRELHTKPPLSFLESLYAAVKLYTLDLGPGNGSSPGPDWQLGLALLMAAGLVARGVLALGRERVRRFTVRRFLSGHVIVCGAGVHGTRLVQTLSVDHDVVLVDLDPVSPGMQELRGPYEWRLIGDGVSERTLRAAGAQRAHWVIAVTGDDFVNSQIVSAVRSLGVAGRARDGVHLLVQVEDPALTRFLEEETEDGGRRLGPATEGGRRPGMSTPPGDVAGARPVVSPFSANAIAAEALLDESRVRLDDGDSLGPLVSMRRGEAPNLLLVGDHPLLDALVLASLRRWRVRILRELEADTGRVRPPMHVSVYGPGAEQRVQRLRERWRPEPSVLTLEGRDSAPPGHGGADFDDWLRKPDRAGHAIVACTDELDGIALTLSVARALGGGARMTRVTTQFENALDAHVEERTTHSSALATTEVKSIADLGAKPAQMSRLPGIQRLTDALARDPGDARARARALFARSELAIRSDSSWRIRGCERSLLEPLLALDTPLAPVALSALVRAGLRVELASATNLLTAAEGLTAAGHPAAFTAWCEYVRHLAPGSAPVRPGPEQPPAISRLLALAGATRGDRDALDRLVGDRRILGDRGGAAILAGGADSVTILAGGAGSVTILAGGAGSMSALTRRELEPLLEPALAGYEGVLLSGGTDVGLPGIAGRVARRQGLRIVGYTPAGLGARELYDTIRETPGATGFSVLEPLGMWTDILGAGLSAGDVRLLVCPGGAITLEEIVLARALGARVGWLDPAGEAPEPLDDILPFGAGGVLELPPDPMTIRAFVTPARPLPEPLREAVARYLHNVYRRAQRRRKSYGDPALARWEELPLSLKASNLAQADDIPHKLTVIGKHLARPGQALALGVKQVELLAEAEHGRWNVERLTAGWQMGPRQVGRSTSPDLRPWAELTEAVREYDRESVRNIPAAIADAGWGVADD